MSDHVAIQAPIVETDAIELAAGTAIFRKQVLKVGSINYKGRRMEFTPDYLDGLALAYREQAFDSVPLVFTDTLNTHTHDVERIRGEILGFERTDDGLDAIVKVPTPKAAELLRNHPRLGVSVRIEQPLERPDGKSWPAAIQHVLATANPRMTGMRPWEPVDLAVDDLPVIDLSTYDFADGEDASTDNTEEIAMADQPSPFTEEEIARLRALLDFTPPADQPSEDGYQLPTDEELAEIAAGLFDDDDDLTDADRAAADLAGASLSSDNEALELAQSRLDSQAIELAKLRTERDVERYEKLRDGLARDHGIPPYITELARPLLTGNHVVELSSGASVDAGDTVRKVLVALGEHAKLIDLSSDTVYDTSDAEKAKADVKAREEEMAAYRREFGL